MPFLGRVDEISRSRISGWVADPQNPHDPVALTIRVNGHAHGGCKADRLNRELIPYVGPTSTGHHGFRYEFDPPLSVFRPQHITVEVAADRNFRLDNGSQQLPIPGVPPGLLTPLIVTSAGGTGTTLMRELASHPKIIAAERSHYDIKLIAHFASAYRTSVSNVDSAKTTPALYSLIRDSGRMAQLFERSIPQSLANLFRRSIEDFYGLLKSDRGKPAARLIAEQVELDQAAREGARLLFGAVREIVLVRDARDILSAAKARWNLSSERAMSILETDLPRLEQVKREAGPDVLFLRYEDLIQQPVETRRRLFEFLGVDYRPPPQRVLGPQSLHAEAESPVGGWRTDLAPDESERCQTVFKTYQDLFGYSSGPREHAAPQIRFHRFEDGKDLAMLLELDGQEWLSNLAVFDCANFKEILVDGWSGIERDYVWSCKPTATLRFDIPDAQGSVYLRLVADSFRLPDKLISQRVQVSVNDSPATEVTVDAIGVIDCRLLNVQGAREVVIRLHFPDARRPCDLRPNDKDDRLLGVSLRYLVVSQTTAATGERSTPRETDGALVPDAATAELMSRFESLGENCEFGLVQRRCGAEPLGLLRFSSAPLPKLLLALQARFAGMGAPDNVAVELSSNGREYMVQDRAFGFNYHAWAKAGEMPPEKIQAREVARVPFLVRKLIEDLSEGRKVFVFHAMHDISVASARKLSEAIRSYGSGLLLWVRLADHKHLAGSIQNLGGGLFAGYIDRFAPGDNAHDLSLQSWIDLCRNMMATLECADDASTVGVGKG